MRIIKQFWQRLVQRFKPRVSGSAGEFEQELSAVRQEQQRLLAQLTGLQAEVERGLSSARQEQENLLGQLKGLQADVEKELSLAGLEKQALRGELTDLQTEVDRGLSATREQQHGLLGQLTGLQAEVERGLSAVRQEEQSLLGRLTGLQVDFERALSAASLERQNLLAQVGELQHDLDRLRRRDEELRDELQQRFDHLQVERDAAQEEIKTLRGSLADAMSRQETTKTRVNTLEIRLQEQQQEHDAALQRALVQERRQARRLTAAMIVATAAFVLGMVGGAINFWEVHNTARLLAEVSQGIRDIQISMRRPAGSAPLPATMAPPAASEKPASTQTPGTPDDAESAPREPADPDQGLSGQKLPEPDFVASKSLPLSDHAFKTRQDARAFFEENAKQPGVVTLPSGLQYRELIPGAGQSPKGNDQVVVEYRAFRPDGMETDNSFKEDLPTAFTVNEAIPALKEALLHMEEGAQWELYIPANLAYPGTRKRGPYAFEPLILTVELLSVVAAEPANQR